jgi:polyisoprenoid-binding protein YceI
MNSFQGFNSALQRTHFNENYLETEKYPKSTYNGKIIEEVDFSQEGNISIRAKGKLLIHGIEQDRIIRCNLIISPDRIDIESDFTVLLEDHNITIPSIVQQKIAEEIEVILRATITPMKQ